MPQDPNTILLLGFSDPEQSEIKQIVGSKVANIVVAEEGEDPMVSLSKNNPSLLVVNGNVDHLRGLISPETGVPAIVLLTGESSNGMANYDHVKVIQRDDQKNHLALIQSFLDQDQSGGSRLQEVENELERFKLVAQNTDNMVMLSNKEGIIDYVNDAAINISGYSKDEIMGTKGEWFRNINEDGPSPEEFYNMVVVEKRKLSYEAKRARKDGSHYWTHTNFYPIGDKDGGIKMIASISSDITHQKEMEEELKEARLRAELSEKAKERFLANMSHEIRTPMNAIIGFAEMIAKTNLDAKQREYLEAIHLSGENLLVIINDILDFSKIEAGKMEIEQIDFLFRKVVEGVDKMLRKKAESKGLQLVVEVGPDVPPVVVGDPVRLSQILINLMNNAIKFTEQGQVSLIIKNLQTAEGKAALQMEVVDTGIGMSEEQLPKIFESFTQASSDTTRKFGGTGLGITIVKRLVDLQGGHLEVRSKVGEGTTFSVVIPYPISDTPESELQTASRGGQETRSIKGVTALLAEDNRINQKLAVEVLQGFGVVVEVADHGQAAYELLQQNTYDILLTDIQMPEMDGYKLSQTIRGSSHLFKDMPIMAMTAHALQEEVQRCMEAGMNDFITKPFKQEDLFDKICRLVPDKVQQVEPGSMATPSEPTAPAPPPVASTESLDGSINLAYLQNTAAGSVSFMKEMIQMLLEDVPGDLQALEAALQADNWGDLQGVAHRMKSSMMLAGNEELTNCFKRLDANGKNDHDATAATADVAKAKALWGKVSEALKAEMDGM